MGGFILKPIIGFYSSMKSMIITKRDIEKARKNNPSIIPASERPWARPTVYKSGREYQRNAKHRNREE